MNSGVKLTLITTIMKLVDNIVDYASDQEPDNTELQELRQKSKDALARAKAARDAARTPPE